MLLNQKVVLVSGVGPGLGVHLVTNALAQGANVVFSCRSRERLAELSQDLQSEGVDSSRYLAVAADICAEDDCAHLISATVTKFGRLDVLINSAYNPGTFRLMHEAPLKDLLQPLQVNYLGTIALTQAAVPELQKTGGNIVMVNTMAVHQTMSHNGGYAASKAALSAASASLALELGPLGIRVNSAFLGWMWGPGVEGYMLTQEQESGVSVDDQKAAVASNIALRRIPTDAECAKAVLMLSTDYMSAMTGASIDINGGEFIPH